MDAIIAYLTQKLKNTFYSHPPSSALILWWPTSSLDQQGTFISRKMDAPPHPLEDCLRETLRASLVLYSYDSEKDLLRFDIEEKCLREDWMILFLKRRLRRNWEYPTILAGLGSLQMTSNR